MPAEPNRFSPRELTWRGRASYAAHLFKAVAKQHHRELVPALRPLVPPDAVVFDVGAHAGQFTKLFARLAPRGRVYAFEPGGYALSILGRAVRWRRLTNVTIVPAALGDRAGWGTLATPIKQGGSRGFGLSHLGRPDGRWPAGCEQVRVLTLDLFAAESGLGRLDFIKADIEGWEGRMIAGGLATLDRFRPALLLELVDGHLARAGDSVAGLWDRLVGLGYRPRLWRAGSGFEELPEPRSGDVFWLPR
ncbi:MAG: FkbM family methyltransferase [Alphaproteobacteria bacterium]